MKPSSSFKNGPLQASHAPLCEINVTPLVDIMLVLLIVFMISTPLLQQGIPLDLPQAKAPSIASSPEPTTLSIDASKHLYLNGKKMSLQTLTVEIQKLVKQNPASELLIESDRLIPYGFVIQIMARIQQAGLTRLNLATQGEGLQSPPDP